MDFTQREFSLVLEPLLSRGSWSNSTLGSFWQYVKAKKFSLRQKMYKFQLKKTGMSKNLKASEALAMSRVKAWRDARGITCEFWRSGKLVDPARLLKFKRLHRIELERLVVEDRHRIEPIEALLPQNIVVLSPDCPYGLVPVKLETTEKVLMSFRDFMICTRPNRQADPSSALYKGASNKIDMQFVWLQMERNSKTLPHYIPVLPCLHPTCHDAAASRLESPSNTCWISLNLHHSIYWLIRMSTKS